MITLENARALLIVPPLLVAANLFGIRGFFAYLASIPRDNIRRRFFGQTFSLTISILFMIGTTAALAAEVILTAWILDNDSVPQGPGIGVQNLLLISLATAALAGFGAIFVVIEKIYGSQ